MDAEELARRMGLTVRDVRFSDPLAMGQVYFDTADAELLDDNGSRYTERIQPGTVLISRDNCNTPAARNGTIVHECCHMYLDRWFFLLQLMTGHPYKPYTSRRKGGREHLTATELGWMELQCDKMPAFILLERESTRRYADRVLSGSSSPEAMRRAVNAVSKHYHVSRSMAKYRMVELGYNEAEGVNCYLDNKVIPDHGCTGKWPEGITFTVSVNDAALLCYNDDIEILLSSGKYRYVEGHFCQNNTKYIVSDKQGRCFLTSYARHHIDECCVAFRPSGRYKDSFYRQGQAARKKTEPILDRYCARYRLAAIPGEQSYTTGNRTFCEDSLRWGDFLYEMSDDYKEAVLDIMRKKGVTQETLALKLPYFISVKLIENAGVSLRRMELHHLYRQFLLQSDVLTVARCNDMLAAKGYEPLFRGNG